MNEENNRKGPGVFYAVVGVATLVVAIIGATFAYFSAATEKNTGVIKGQTNDDIGGALTLTVEPVALNPNPTPTSSKLVPADFGVTPDNMTSTLVNNALSRKCVEGGYTGCHVYKITASSTQTVAVADINLHLELNSEMHDKNDWAYVVYTGTDTSADNADLIAKNYITTQFTEQNPTQDIHNSGLTAGTPQVYYLMVYLNNVDSQQNATITPGAQEGDPATVPAGTTNALGSYSGTVQLLAAGGQVKATFTTAAPVANPEG